MVVGISKLSKSRMIQLSVAFPVALGDFGVVLFSRPIQTAPRNPLPTSAKKAGIYKALLALCSRTALWKCDALNTIQSTSDKERCADIGMLVKLVATVYLDNDHEAFNTCLNSIIAYVKNIIKASRMSPTRRPLLSD